MTKTELVAAIAERTKLPKTNVDAVLKGFFDVVSDTVALGKEKVAIPGYISFEQVTRPPRAGRNLRTGQPISVPATKAVKITAGAKLKAAAKGENQPAVKVSTKAKKK
ncbi:MAG: HU family DNA-binding protein [Acidimicrobiales bacterium]